MSRSMQRRFVALLAVLALTAAACGSGSDGDDPSDTGDATTSDDSGGSDNGDGASGEGSEAATPAFMEGIECPVDAHIEAGEPVEIVLWHTLVALTAETIQDFADQYNASQDLVTVTIESQGNDYEELERKYIAGIPDSNLPNIAVIEDILTRRMADTRTVLPAQTCLDAEGLTTEQFNPTSLSYYTVDGALLPGAWNASTDLLYFNKGHMEAAGLDPENPPTNLAEIREAAEAIKAAGASDKPFVMRASGWFFESMLNGAGIALMDNDNGRAGPPTEVNFTDPAVIELFTELQAMADEGLFDPVADAPGQFNHYLALATQSSSMGIETSTAATSVEAFLNNQLDLGDIEGSEDAEGVDEAAVADAQSLDIGASFMPGITEAGDGAMGGNGWYMTLAGTPEEQAATWDFIKFVQDAQQQELMFTKGSYLPMTPGSLDGSSATDFTGSSLAGQWLQISNDQLTALDPTAPGGQAGAYREIRDAFQSAIDRILQGGEDPATALAEEAETANEAIADYNDTYGG